MSIAIINTFTMIVTVLSINAIFILVMTKAEDRISGELSSEAISLRGALHMAVLHMQPAFNLITAT